MFSPFSLLDNRNLVAYRPIMCNTGRWAVKDWTPADIKALRNRLNVPRKAFADLLGVSRQYVDMLEWGKRVPSKLLKGLLNRVEKELAISSLQNQNGKGGEKTSGARNCPGDCAKRWLTLHYAEEAAREV